MSVSLEPLFLFASFGIYVLRGGPDHTLGSPYEFSCTVVKTEDQAEIKGLSGKLSLSSYRAIRKALIDHGVSAASWERVKGGKLKLVEVLKKEGE